MSELGDKQRKFARDFTLLLQYAFSLGYKVTFPPEHENHIPNSLHYIGLAKDINLFIDNDYLTETEDYKDLGAFWRFLGNTWGGDWGDGNHFSIEHNGVK